MSKSALVTRNWTGGASVDPKIGADNSFKRSQSIDTRKRMSSIRLHKKTVKESGSIVTSAVFDAVRTPDRNLYFMGGDRVYRRIPEVAGGNGTYSVFQTGLSNVKSGVYNRDRKKVYMPGDSTVHAINYFDPNTPAFQTDLINRLLDHSKVNTGSNVYTLSTTINEGATHKYSWQPDLDPLVRVAFWVVAKGTGDVTVTIHDAANNVIATKVVLNAALANGQLNYADFTTQIRVQAKPNPQTYHVHLTVSTGTTTVRTATASDLATMDIETYGGALLSGVYHPAGEFLQFVVIGNGNYVAVWEPITDAPLKTEFDPHRLKLPSEYNVLGFAEWNEYYVISAYKSVSSDYGNEFGVNATEGLLAFWDGASKGFAWFKKIEGGAFESPFTYNGLVYGYINGVLHVTSGDIPVPVFPIPGTDDFASTHGNDDDVYLQAPYKGMCVKDNLLQLAYPMVSGNDNVHPGVYGFGKKSKDYVESITFDHIPSHGSSDIAYNGSNIPMSGLTYTGSFGKNMFIAWQHFASGVQTFGIDVVRENNPCYPEGFVDYLDIDNKLTYKKKEALEVIVTYEGELPAGATVVPRYRIDGESEYQYGDENALRHDADNKQFILKVPKKYHVVEYGVKLIAANGLSPVVTSTTIVVDSRNEEGL